MNWQDEVEEVDGEVKGDSLFPSSITTKTPGSDEIFPRALKDCKADISGHLSGVFRKSPDTGVLVVPDSWRQALGIPVYKEESKY